MRTRERGTVVLLGCLGLAVTGVVLGVTLVLVVAVPVRHSDPGAAWASLALAVASFVLAGTGAALALLSRTVQRARGSARR